MKGRSIQLGLLKYKLICVDTLGKKIIAVLHVGHFKFLNSPMATHFYWNYCMGLFLCWLHLGWASTFLDLTLAFLLLENRLENKYPGLLTRAIPVKNPSSITIFLVLTLLWLLFASGNFIQNSCNYCEWEYLKTNLCFDVTTYYTLCKLYAPSFHMHLGTPTNPGV